MKYRLLLTLLIGTLAASSALAQKRYVVDGVIADKDQQYCLMYAAAAALQKESSLANGVRTDSLGRFKLERDNAGD